MAMTKIYGVEIDFDSKVSKENLGKIFEILKKEDEKTFCNLERNYSEDILSTCDLMETMGIPVSASMVSYFIGKLVERRYPKYKPMSETAFWSLINEIECNKELKIFLSYI